MDRTSAVKSLVETLKAEIPTAYKPGDYLPNERLVAARFGVSRNTVREALIFLEAYGIVEKTQRGPRVCAPDVRSAFHIMDQYFDRSLETCRDLLAFRRFIEMGILPDVIEKITDEDLAALKESLDRMARSLTAREAAQFDYEFHNHLVRISGNGVLHKLYRVLSQTLIYYMEIGKSVRKHGQTTVDDHSRILNALRERSLEKVVAASRDHYQYSEDVLLETIRQDKAAAELEITV